MNFWKNGGIPVKESEKSISTENEMFSSNCICVIIDWLLIIDLKYCIIIFHEQNLNYQFVILTLAFLLTRAEAENRWKFSNKHRQRFGQLVVLCGERKYCKKTWNKSMGFFRNSYWDSLIISENSSKIPTEHRAWIPTWTSLNFHEARLFDPKTAPNSHCIRRGFSVMLHAPWSIKHCWIKSSKNFSRNFQRKSPINFCGGFSKNCSKDFFFFKSCNSRRNTKAPTIVKT